MHIPCCRKFTVFRSSHKKLQGNVDKPDGFRDKNVVNRLAVLKCDTNEFQKVIITHWSRNPPACTEPKNLRFSRTPLFI